MLHRFLVSDKDTGRFAEFIRIEKIEYFKNPKLETQFEDSFRIYFYFGSKFSTFIRNDSLGRASII